MIYGIIPAAIHAATNSPIITLNINMRELLSTPLIIIFSILSSEYPIYRANNDTTTSAPKSAICASTDQHIMLIQTTDTTNKNINKLALKVGSLVIFISVIISFSSPF